MFEPICREPAEEVIVTDPSVVYGHRVCQTHDVKWLHLDSVYQKLHRPNFYDIGGTYMQDVADYWFTYKTEQVGKTFLLHLFITNHGLSSFNVSVSCSNKFKIDKKNGIVYLKNYLKECQFKQLPELTYSYLHTYGFSECDVEMLKDMKLYIEVSFTNSDSSVSLEVIEDVKFKHDCSALFNDPIGSDFVIESADGVKFNIHKVILAAHSEVFKAMLKEDTAESQNSYVKLVDVNGEDLRYMLEYMYSGTLQDLENINFANLLMLADRYNLKGLWELSEHALSEQMNIDNALDILMVADIYDSDFLKLEALKFIKENKEILTSSSFKEITNTSLIKEVCAFIAL